MKKATEEQIKSSELYPVKAYNYSNTNSTPFTDCCNCACINEEKCPSCDRCVIYYDCEPNARQGLRSSFAYRRNRLC